MLQAAGDLGLEEEPLAADRVVGVVVEDLLEGHLAVQLAVQRHEDGAQAAPGVGPEDAEPLAVAGGRRRRRSMAVASSAGSVEAEPTEAERGVDVGVARPPSFSRVERPPAIGGQAPLDVAACFFRCSATIASTAAPAVGVEVAPGDEVVGQAAGIFRESRPGRRRRGAPGRSARSERQHPEEKMAVGSHRIAPPSTTGRGGSGPVPRRDGGILSWHAPRVQDRSGEACPRRAGRPADRGDVGTRALPS